MSAAVALSNNDVALLLWRRDQKIANCLGFAVYRKDGAAPGPGEGEALPAWVGFQGEGNPAWTQKTTETWPVQKFEWKDLTATRGKRYGYRIVPMVGQPGALVKREDLALTCGPVSLTPARGSFAAYFNRGILSTQFISHQIPAGPNGQPDYRVLLNRIDQPGDPLRQGLAGQILDALEFLLNRAANEGGDCYAALYELSDPELVAKLLAAQRLHIILSNTGSDDSENKPARQALHEKGIDIVDRFVPSGHIGHNKFVVYVAPGGQATSVLLGSTNWTDTAICAQSNNALILDNPVLAKTYFDYWQRLHTDTDATGHGAQGPGLRSSDAQAGAEDVVVDEGKATVWFSPNTPRARPSPPPPGEATPVDLGEVFQLMRGARKAIIFLAFEPGVPSIVDVAGQVSDANPDLFVRGAVTDPKAVAEFNTMLVHRRPGDAVEVVPATGIHDQFYFWEAELLKAGPGAHAIIHDKIVVIDPMSDDCVVVTGSHNLGFRASYDNDENLLIVRGHKELAQAYAVHVMEVYDHYRFRYVVQQAGAQAFSGLDKTGSWQDKYFNAADPASRDASVWLG